MTKQEFNTGIVTWGSLINLCKRENLTICDGIFSAREVEKILVKEAKGFLMAMGVGTNAIFQLTLENGFYRVSDEGICNVTQKFPEFKRKVADIMETLHAFSPVSSGILQKGAA